MRRRGGTVLAIHELYVYLRAKDAEAAVAFYKAAFGATELFRLTEPGGRIGHVELDFGGTTVMLSSEFPEFGIHAPAPEAPSGFETHMVGLAVERAEAAAEDVVLEPGQAVIIGDRVVHGSHGGKTAESDRLAFSPLFEVDCTSH